MSNVLKFPVSQESKKRLKKVNNNPNMSFENVLYLDSSKKIDHSEILSHEIEIKFEEGFNTFVKSINSVRAFKKELKNLFNDLENMSFEDSQFKYEILLGESKVFENIDTARDTVKDLTAFDNTEWTFCSTVNISENDLYKGISDHQYDIIDDNLFKLQSQVDQRVQEFIDNVNLLTLSKKNLMNKKEFKAVKLVS